MPTATTVDFVLPLHCVAFQSGHVPKGHLLKPSETAAAQALIILSNQHHQTGTLYSVTDHQSSEENYFMTKQHSPIQMCQRVYSQWCLTRYPQLSPRKQPLDRLRTLALDCRLNILISVKYWCTEYLSKNEHYKNDLVSQNYAVVIN